MAIDNRNASNIVKITAATEYSTECSIRVQTALLEYFDLDSKLESICHACNQTICIHFLFI